MLIHMNMKVSPQAMISTRWWRDPYCCVRSLSVFYITVGDVWLLIVPASQSRQCCFLWRVRTPVLLCFRKESVSESFRHSLSTVFLLVTARRLEKEWEQWPVMRQNVTSVHVCIRSADCKSIHPIWHFTLLLVLHDFKKGNDLGFWEDCDKALIFIMDFTWVLWTSETL